MNLNIVNRQNLIQQGYLLLNQKLYDHAVRIFSNILSQNPEDVEALVGLASSYQHQNKTEEAIKIAKTALEINPTYFYAYDILAEIYFINKNDYLKAEEFALKSLDIEPYSSYTYSLLSQIYYFQKRFDACYDYAIESLNIDPENYVAHMALGLYYYHIPDFDKAEEHYRACLAIAPNSSVVYGNYGLLNLAFAKNIMGYKLLKEAVRLNPEDSFLQESFREAYIRNHPVYAPLNWLSGGKFDDVYIIYAIIILMMLAAFLVRIHILPKFIEVMLLVIFLFCVILFLLLVFYRLITRSIINYYYSWAIKTGKLSKIV